ncbi:MAG TPA: FkbM family methyltransferase, partial [Bacteroidia bacterium]|nr:FkbM family methyltransferase [Bacteroidia bacterium]
MLQRKEYINAPLSTEQDVLRFFDKADALVIFDIGACEGEDSIKYSRLFPNAKVHSFEPVPKNIKIVEDNLKTYEAAHVKLIPVALSNKIGKQVLNVSSGRPEDADAREDWDYGNKSSSLLPPDEVLATHKWLKFPEQIEVQTDTLSNYCSTNKIDCIDFIHMDVQGAELIVLEGAGNFITNIKAIWLEVSDIAMYKNQPLRKDLENFMKAHNFRLYKSIVHDKFGDQFYINKKYFPGFVYSLPHLKARLKRL